MGFYIFAVYDLRVGFFAVPARHVEQISNQLELMEL
jgi:hypothetical protein